MYSDGRLVEDVVVNRRVLIKTGVGMSAGSLILAVIFIFYFMVDSLAPVPSNPDDLPLGYISTEDGLSFSLITLQLLTPVFGIGMLVLIFGLFQGSDGHDNATKQNNS